jgi:hypothetical protein
MVKIEFELQQPFVVDLFKIYKGRGKIAIIEGNSIVMLGKVIDVQFCNFVMMQLKNKIFRKKNVLYNIKIFKKNFNYIDK